MQGIYDFLLAVSDFVWGPVMLVLLVGTGVYLNIGLRFFSFRNLGRAFKCLLSGGGNQKGHGEVSPWNALMTALAAAIGTGNIVGVATAIAVGGPGALFWMWVTAIVGMMTKFSEVMLAVHFGEKTPAGNWVGGAMYFIRNGLGKNWHWLASAFALFGMVACIGTGAMVQSNAISVNMKDTFSIPNEITAGLLFVLATTILLGGVKRVGAVAGKLVPTMAFAYIIMCLVVICMNITSVPAVLWHIICDAFTPTAAQGGFAGASVLLAIRMGMARGVFANEAGLGSAPIAHAASTAESPLVQATIGMLDVFIVSIVICTMTGLAILLAFTPEGQPLWCSGLDGGVLASMAFQANLAYAGKVGVTICLTLFAFTTALGWCVYGERCAIYIFGDRVQKLFRVVYILAMTLGAVLALDIVWLLSDIFNALMAFPNIAGVLLLSPLLFRLVREEVAKDGRFKL